MNRRAPTPRSTFEFHVSRDARERYDFDEELFGLTGNVVFADFAAARRFAQKMNALRDLAADPGAAVRPGDINAMGLIDEILHFVVEQYRLETNPDVISGALRALEDAVGQQEIQQTLTAFAERFPTVSAYRGEQSAEDYLQGETNGIPNREVALEELLMLWLANGNPAFDRY